MDNNIILDAKWPIKFKEAYSVTCCAVMIYTVLLRDDYHLLLFPVARFLQHIVTSEMETRSCFDDHPIVIMWKHTSKHDNLRRLTFDNRSSWCLARILTCCQHVFVLPMLSVWYAKHPPLALISPESNSHIRGAVLTRRVICSLIFSFQKVLCTIWAVFCLLLIACCPLVVRLLVL